MKNEMKNETTGTRLFLEAAERFAESRGLGKKFRKEFESKREFWGVLEAARKALANLKLYNTFMVHEEMLRISKSLEKV